MLPETGPDARLRVETLPVALRFQFDALLSRRTLSVQRGGRPRPAADLL